MAKGMQVVATSVHVDDSQLLLNLLGFPFRLEQSLRSSTAHRVGMVLLLASGVLSCEEERE